jgi:2-methylfumaryl-CoA hydratase
VKTIEIGGPWFEDLVPGLEFDAPAVTLTSGLATAYQALGGDRLRLPLDHATSARVTGASAPLAHPLLAFNVGIGQTTWASQRVRANLGYRGLRLLRPVYLGETVRTVTRVVGARSNAARPGRAATGVVALESTTYDAHGERVLHGWRFPMIPCRDPDSTVERSDDLDAIGTGVDVATLVRELPAWDLGAFAPSKAPTAAAEPGMRFRIDARDSVTGATEWVRLTLNLANAHLDPGATPTGKRLVYGGHTIAIAFAQATRALPDLLTMLAWERCDHVAPVFEEDVLRTELDVLDRTPAPRGAVLRLRTATFATAPAGGDERLVLDWTFFVWVP